MPSDLSDDGREPMDSPWTDLAARPSPYDDFTASQEAGPIVRGTLRRFPRWGRLLLVSLFVVLPVLPLVLVRL